MKINPKHYAKLVKLMMEGTYTCHELSDMTGLAYATVLSYAKALYLEKAAHISMWEKDSRGRDVTKIYKMGEGKDARRQKMPRSEVYKRYRDKQKHKQLLRMMVL